MSGEKMHSVEMPAKLSPRHCSVNVSEGYKGKPLYGAALIYLSYQSRQYRRMFRGGCSESRHVLPEAIQPITFEEIKLKIPTSRRKTAATIDPIVVGDYESPSEVGSRQEHVATADCFDIESRGLVPRRGSRRLARGESRVPRGDVAMDPGVVERAPMAWDRVMEEVAAILTLDESGNIRECKGAIQQLSGYAVRELLGCHVSMLFPRLGHADLLQGNEVDPKLGYLFHIGFPFKLCHRDKKDCLCRISLVDLRNGGEPRRLVMMVSVAGSPVGFH